MVLNFFKFLSFYFIFWKTKKAIHTGVAGQIFKISPMAHGVGVAARINFEKFPPILKN
jgi:hypothetical protein